MNFKEATSKTNNYHTLVNLIYVQEGRHNDRLIGFHMFYEFLIMCGFARVRRHNDHSPRSRCLSGVKRITNSFPLWFKRLRVST